MIIRCQCVFDSEGKHILHLIPPASASVQFRQQVRSLTTQFVLQQTGRQVVIAVPVSLIVKRDDKQVGRQQLIQATGAIGLPCYSITYIGV